MQRQPKPLFSSISERRGGARPSDAQAKLGRGGGQQKAARVYMEVDIGGGKSGRIALFDGADSRALAAAFVQQHALAAGVVPKLAGLIQSTMESNGIPGPGKL